MADNVPAQAASARNKELNMKDLIYAGAFYSLYSTLAFCSAAENAPSMAGYAILAASLAALLTRTPTWRIFGSSVNSDTNLTRF